MSKPTYADLGDLPEDERMDVIAQVVRSGKSVAFIVDNDAKAERYLRKLRKRCSFTILSRGPGPVKNTVYVKVGPITH